MPTKTNMGIIAAAAVGLYIIFNNSASAAPGTANQSGFFDLSQFNDSYGADNVQRLADLYNVLLSVNDPNNNFGLSITQQQLLLSQALLESGLFTSNPNYNLVDNFHNYTGIKGNSQYPAAPGSQYVAYPDIPAYVGDWLRVLSLDRGQGAPLEAITVADFARRLNANGYFTSSPTIYQSNLQSYYNQLNNVAVI